MHGLSDRRPGLAAAMAIFMFAGGIPPFVGFFAKFFIFSAAAEAGWIGLVVIGVINSVISAFYYLSVVVAMYFRSEKEAAPAAPVKARKSKDKAAPAPATASCLCRRRLLWQHHRTRSGWLSCWRHRHGAVGLYPAVERSITRAVQSVFGG